jgi:hypothetical protein
LRPIGGSNASRLVLIASEIWVAALVRRVELAGSFATVARRGDARAGAVLVKTFDRRSVSCRLFSGVQRGEERIWMQPLSSGSEAEVDAYVDRARQVDPDLWVVEIEDANGRRFLTEPVEGD